MIEMGQPMLSVRVSQEDKSRFEEFCARTGMNVSVCINMFVKVVLRDQKLPFEIKAVSDDKATELMESENL